VDRASLLRACAANHRAWFRRTGSGAVERVPGGLEIILGGRDGGTLGFPAPRARSSAVLDATMRRAGELGVTAMACWSLDDDRSLGARLLARGFGWGWQPHWMSLDLASAGEQPPQHPVVAMPREYRRALPYASPLEDPPSVRHLAVCRRGVAVGHLVVNPWRGYAGIYSMGVVPRLRRQGIGRSLIAAARDVAREAGCTHLLLNATAAGELLYANVGFESLGKGRTWWIDRGPRPSARQTELAEAAGLGDVAALSALSPTSRELEEALPGAGSLLAIAALTNALASVEWILTRRPELVSRRLEHDGGTLLHLAVGADDERLVAVALAHGAELSVRDGEWNATPLQWAEHLERPGLAALLREAGR
jgi:GNAT superfamily N-acetyltransferase